MLTKEEFLKRCETIYDLKLLEDPSKLRSATEVYLRLRHVYSEHPEAFEEIKRNHQGKIAIEELTNWGTDIKKENFGYLASDQYNLVEAASILAHPCQKCAVDKKAWHTRYSFCKHQLERE